DGGLRGWTHVGKAALLRLAAPARQARQRHRRAHQRQHLAPVETRRARVSGSIHRDRDAELAVEMLLEVLGPGELLEAAPVLAPAQGLEPAAVDREGLPLGAHRWHVQHSVSSLEGRMWYCALSRS